MNCKEKLLEVRDIHKVYTKEGVPTKALNGITFDVLDGEFLVFGFVVTSLVLISFISHLQSRLVPLLRFARLGCHQAVQFCISWKRIFKWHQISGTADQTMAGTHIGDVG